MTISIRRNIRALVAPQHRISCSKQLWEELRRELAARGDGRRESGAFLLGTIDRAGRREIRDFVLYDQLDPSCLTGIIEFNGEVGFGKLYSLCREKKLDVVADVHTHPGLPYQSRMDQDNPMMSRQGHIALILPDFAQKRVKVAAMGIYHFKGGCQWDNWSGPEAHRLFYTGFWAEKGLPQ